MSFCSGVIFGRGAVLLLHYCCANIIFWDFMDCCAALLNLAVSSGRTEITAVIAVIKN